MRETLVHKRSQTLPPGRKKHELRLGRRQHAHLFGAWLAVLGAGGVQGDHLLRLHQVHLHFQGVGRLCKFGHRHGKHMVRVVVGGGQNQHLLPLRALFAVTQHNCLLELRRRFLRPI